MTAHQPTLTRIAVDAILAQITAKSDCENTYYAEVDGGELEWTAWFTTEWDGPFDDDDGHGDYWESHCTLIGAYAEHPETEAMFAGSKAEIEALIGAGAVRQWEIKQAEREQEAGQ